MDILENVWNPWNSWKIVEILCNAWEIAQNCGEMIGNTWQSSRFFKILRNCWYWLEIARNASKFSKFLCNSNMHLFRSTFSRRRARWEFGGLSGQGHIVRVLGNRDSRRKRDSLKWRLAKHYLDVKCSCGKIEFWDIGLKIGHVLRELGVKIVKFVWKKGNVFWDWR